MTWPEETLWVLDQCATDTMFVGHCGFLDFGTPEFVKYFDRFRANKLFLGVRYANRTGRNFEEGIKRPVFLADIKTMTDAGLVLEYGNLTTILRLTDMLPPTAKVVIPHLPRVRLPQNSADGERYRATLRELGKRPNVAFKLSGVTKTIDGKVVSDLSVPARLAGRDMGYFWRGPHRVRHRLSTRRPDRAISERVIDLHVIRQDEIANGARESALEKFCSHLWVEQACAESANGLIPFEDI